ncbi:hypothetical protein quinque_007501 [Culex quinquefasciatus]
MSAAYVLLVLTSIASIVFACNYPTRHYKSMGCSASYQKSSNGCPAHFDCPNLTDRKTDKCYIHGKVYDIGERVPSEETAGSCTILFCSGFNDTAFFNIAIIDCAEFFAPSGIDCVRQYRRGQCCSYGSVCGHSRNNLRTCAVGNETLYEGQRYAVKGDPCKICICAVDSGGFPVENCFEQRCTFEFTDADKLLAGAAPVYEKGWCCPVDWRLPSENDKIVNTNCSVESHGHKCFYGNLTLNVGDVLEREITAQGTINCRCEIPPMVHCELDDTKKNN